MSLLQEIAATQQAESGVKEISFVKTGPARTLTPAEEARLSQDMTRSLGREKRLLPLEEWE